MQVCVEWPPQTHFDDTEQRTVHVRLVGRIVGHHPRCVVRDHVLSCHVEPRCAVCCREVLGDMQQSVVPFMEKRLPIEMTRRWLHIHHLDLLVIFLILKHMYSTFSVILHCTTRNTMNVSLNVENTDSCSEICCRPSPTVVTVSTRLPTLL